MITKFKSIAELVVYIQYGVNINIECSRAEKQSLEIQIQKKKDKITELQKKITYTQSRIKDFEKEKENYDTEANALLHRASELESQAADRRLVRNLGAVLSTGIGVMLVPFSGKY